MPPGYYRYPTLYVDTVVFVCEEICGLSSSGGIARHDIEPGKHQAPFPRRKWLAFVGRERRSGRIYRMPREGRPRRTYLGGTFIATAAWTSEGSSLPAMPAMGTGFHLPIYDPFRAAKEGRQSV
jgi:tricorn protease-like protein